MAKKSTKTKPITEVDGKQAIEYQGIIKITTMHGKKTVATKTYKNSGLPALFKFLCNALGGRNTTGLRPSAIKLFAAQEGKSGYAPSSFVWGSDSMFTDYEAATPMITYDATPVIKKVANTSQSTAYDYHYTTTFHFRIPQSYITNNTIRFAAIYPENNIEDDTEACAFYLFTTKDTDGSIIWDDFNIPAGATDYSLIIEWTMAVMNK